MCIRDSLRVDYESSAPQTVGSAASFASPSGLGTWSFHAAVSHSATPQYDDTRIESCINGRFLFETSDSGDITSTRGNEGTWVGVYNTPVVTADTDYSEFRVNRTQWRLVPLGGGEWLIASSLTGRYLFETSDSGDIRSTRGNEGGWVGVNNKPVVTADANYYDLAQWKLVPIRAGQYRIESSVTGRYLFETSHLNNKPVVTADEDYYNLACWKVTV